MRPDISVVIPTYRRPQLLLRCLHALSVQSIATARYEVTVVSDGKDDETQQLLEVFSKSVMPIKYYFLHKRSGPAAARNAGWTASEAPLVAFTDDDCIPDVQWLQGLLAAHPGEPLAAFTGIVKVPASTPPTDHEKNVAGLETADFVTANCCCTRKALELVGGFDERFYMAWREDSDLEFKLMLHNIPISYKVDAVVSHPARPAKWGVSVREQKKSMFNALLYKKYPRLYRHKIQAWPRWDYYVIICAWLLVVAGLMMTDATLAMAGLAIWALLTTRFIYKRLATTSRKRSHVLEMIATSIAIPIVCVYWRLYGACKYRVFFL